MNTSVLVILLFLITIRVWIYFFLSMGVVLWQYTLPKSYVEEQAVNNRLLVSYINIHKSYYKQFKSRIRSIIVGIVRLHVFYTTYIPSHHIRNFVYRHIYRADIGRHCIIYYGAELRSSQLLHIGDGSIIGDKATLDARRGGIFIGRFVSINSNVSMWTDSHDMNDPYFRSVPGKRGPIHVGDRVFIGPNVTILHSVNIVEGAVIAAGSVVTKDVEPYTVVAGVPAKKIGERSRDLLYTYPSSYSLFL